MCKVTKYWDQKGVYDDEEEVISVNGVYYGIFLTACSTNGGTKKDTPAQTKSTGEGNSGG